MSNPFKPQGPSKIGRELQRSATLSRAMTEWVDKQRGKGIEPWYFSIKTKAGDKDKKGGSA